MATERRLLAGPPRGEVVIPVVVAIAAGRRLEAVWANELGGYAEWSYGPGWEALLLDA